MSTLSKIIDQHFVEGQYWTCVVDLWEGDATDPATHVTRYLGAWRHDSLDFEPDFSGVNINRYKSEPKPRPLIWEELDIAKQADQEAAAMRQHDENLLEELEPNRYMGESQRRARDEYKQFLNAIDRLHADDTDEEAWQIVTEYRQSMQFKHER